MWERFRFSHLNLVEEANTCISPNVKLFRSNGSTYCGCIIVHTLTWYIETEVYPIHPHLSVCSSAVFSSSPQVSFLPQRWQERSPWQQRAYSEVRDRERKEKREIGKREQEEGETLWLKTALHIHLCLTVSVFLSTSVLSFFFLHIDWFPRASPGAFICSLYLSLQLYL